MTILDHLLLSSADQTRRQVMDAQRQGKSVGVVMTMGALHDGHLSLVRCSIDECDFTVVTVFVNPTQFGPGEDFVKYPRQLTRDLEVLQELCVDLVFAPEADEMYRPDHSTFVDPPSVAANFEGKCRPGHFRGVSTIVLKLLQVIPANMAYFGQKDYQQYLVIRDMITDLKVATTIRSLPTIRDSDGLALSSRNRYLNATERQQALSISQCLTLAQELVDSGTRHVAALTSRMREVLQSTGIECIDYVAIADPDTLQEVRTVDRRVVALIAAHVGRTRLIDNKLLSVR